MKTWRYCLGALGIALAAALLAASEARSDTGAVPPAAEGASGYTRPPSVAGTYHGSYTEIKNGESIRGTVEIAIQAEGLKIRGPFKIRGHGNRFYTDFVGRIKQSSEGATLLRFQVVALAGYDDNVHFHARLTGRSLEGEGHSPEESVNAATRWKFEATKASQ